MENVLLIVELILALFLIIVVLLQRSEGGALGMGGGGGGVVSGRGAATALTKVTWVLAAGFFAVALTLTLLASQRAAERSLIDGTAIEGAADGGVPLAADDALDADLQNLIAPPPGANPLIPPAAE
ncbi:MAG: preprotein translocase subunit SecG [Paracoccaceae bacterium]|jgi:preprotein translocase subunit SecG